MENIILIKTQSIEFIQGKRKRDAVNISHHAHVKIDDNAIINGVIIDDTSIKEALAELKSQYDIEECILILDSNKIIARSLVIPKMSKKRIIEHLKNEFATLYEGDEEMLYDYGFIGEDEEIKRAVRILGVGIEKDLITTYLNLFESLEIDVVDIDFSINILIRLKEYLPNMTDGSFSITRVDGNEIISSVFSKGNYVLTTRNRIFSDISDTQSFGSDIVRAISQLQQFANSPKNNAPFSTVYFSGLSPDVSDLVCERISNILDIESMMLPKAKGIYYDKENEEEVSLNNYLNTLGYLIGE